MSEQTPPEHDDIPEQAVDAQPQAMDIPEFADDSVDFQTARIAELEGQLKDLQLRTQAEVQNIQRRSERDVTAAHKFALEKFAGSLLDVADNLERALQATPSEEPALKALHEGVTLTHKLFVDTMKRFGVEAVDPLGEPFNPELHHSGTELGDCGIPKRLHLVGTFIAAGHGCCRECWLKHIFCLGIGSGA